MPRNVNSSPFSSNTVRRKLRSALFKMVEAKRGLILGLPESSRHYGTVRQYSSHAPVAGGGSIAFHFMNWRADSPMPSCGIVLKLSETLKEYGLHTTVEQVDRVHTNLAHGHGKTVTSLVVTLKWREDHVQEVTEEAYAPKQSLPCPPQPEPATAQTYPSCPPQSEDNSNADSAQQ